MQSQRKPQPYRYTEIEHLIESLQQAGARPLHWRRNIRLIPTDADVVDDAVWGAHYQRECEPLHEKRHAKAQYVAAWLEKRADGMRKDLAQLYYRQLMEFLIGYQETGWAQYRMGKLVCQGKGTSIDKEEGMRYIIQAIKLGDYRGAHLCLAQDTPSLQPTDLANLSSSLKINLVELCQRAYQENSGKAATILGYLFEISGDSDRAEGWYSLALRTVKPDLDAVSQLRSFYERYDGLDSDAFILDKWLQHIKDVTRLSQCLPVLGALYYQCVYHYSNLEQTDLAREALARAVQCGHADAIYEQYRLDEAAWMNSSQQCEQTRPIYEDLINVCQFNQEAAVEYVSNCVRAEGEDVLKRRLVTQFNEGYYAISFGVCVALLRGTDEAKQEKLAEIAKDATYLWWLQMAFQYANNRDYQQFILFVNARLKAKTLPTYCACAIGFLYLLGVPGTSHADANQKEIREANQYFQLAIEKNEEAVIQYLVAGKRLGFLTSELQQVLADNVMVVRPLLEVVEVRLKQEVPQPRRRY